MAYSRETPVGRWTQLEGERQTLMSRCEDYAALTIPSVCMPEGYNQFNVESSMDWQSDGAAGVIHLANKLMLTLFAPSRPFFRLDPSDKVIADASMANITEDQIAELLSNAERKAIAVMNKAQGGTIRPKLLQLLIALIVVGNVMLFMDKKQFRVIPFKKYVAKRDVYGNLIEFMIKDRVKVCQLDKEVQEIPFVSRRDKDDEVDHYQWYRINDNDDFELTQWIDSDQLPKQFSGKYPRNKCPAKVLTWSLQDGYDYGTGYVETIAPELRSLSILSKSMVQGAALAAEFRWLVNPAGITSVDDLENSENGAALPGQQGDITPLTSGTGQVLQYMQVQKQSHQAAIARAFLMGSVTTRQAERVTAVEIQRDAAELETSLGGAYNRIAIELQGPLAYYLLEEVKMKLGNKDLEPVVITGMDALSRGQDVENAMQFVAAVGNLQQLNPNVNLMGHLNTIELVRLFAAGAGVDSGKYMSSPQQQQQTQDQVSSAPGPGTSPAAAAEQQAATQPPPEQQM